MKNDKWKIRSFFLVPFAHYSFRDKRNHVSVLQRTTFSDAAYVHNELRTARHFP